MTNFSQYPQQNESQPAFHEQSNSKKLYRLFLKKRVLLIIALAAALGLTVMNVFTAQAAMQKAQKGKDAFFRSKDLLLNQEFDAADESLKEAQLHFTRSQSLLRRLWSIRWIPLVGRQIRSVDHAFTAAIQTSLALQKITILASDVSHVLKNKNAPSFSQISSEEKREILKKIYQSSPEIMAAKSDIDLAVISLNRIPSWGLLRPIQTAVDSMNEYLPAIQTGLAEAIPATETLPRIIGYPESQTYLFLLQNNTELRPTGGFIGTVGVLQVENGEIKKFHTENVYNIDNPAKNHFFEKPPKPISTYLKMNQWFLRDSNWDPDFPTSAKRAEEFYGREGGPEKNFDGVIAVTPTLIEALIGLTGSITVDGITFTKDNFVEVLQYQVEQGYYRQGISDAERKEIIGDMADELMNRLLAFPKDRWIELWEVMSRHLNEKNILLFHDDPEIEKMIIEQNWGGSIQNIDAGKDFLMIVDANLASLKTDPAVKRTIRYDISLDHGTAIAKTNMEYVHGGEFKWKITRYRTYTRFIVPLESQLRASQGGLKNDKLHGKQPTEAETLDAQWGKTIFGIFTAIEPKTTGNVEMTYELPLSIAQSLERGEYGLIIQKQPGTNHQFQSTIEMGKQPKRILINRKEFKPSGLDKTVSIENNTVHIQTDLITDFRFEFFP